MTKLKKFWAAAAALVIAGVAVVTALDQAAEAEHLTCKQWRAVAERSMDEQAQHRFFMDVSENVEVLNSITRCNTELRWRMKPGPLVNGRRLHRVRAVPRIAGLLKRWASVTPGVRWYGEASRAWDQCLGNHSLARCRSLFQVARHCWRLGDDTVPVMACDPAWESPDLPCSEPPCEEWPCAKVCPPRTPCDKIQVGTRDVPRFCRHGKLYGYGMGGDDACPYTEIVAPMPCVVNRGASSGLHDAARAFTDEELDE